MTLPRSKGHKTRPGGADKIKSSMELLLKHSSVIPSSTQDLSRPPVKAPLAATKPSLAPVGLDEHSDIDQKVKPIAEPRPSLKKEGLDISAAIHEHARKVRTADLAAKHLELEVVRMADVLTLVQEAVDEAVQHSERDWNEKERKRLLEEAEEEFNERLKTFKVEKADLVAQAKHFKEQLEKAQALLEEERQKVVRADQFTVSDAGLVELDKRLSRLLDKAVLRGGASQELQEEMRAMVAKLLDDEREKISQKAREAQSEAISLLERKVNRLASSLDETQRAREEAEERARLLESAKGNFVLQNIYKAGLNEKDPKKDKKLNLLKDIAKGNRDIREHMIKVGMLPKPAPQPAAAPPAPAPVTAAVAVPPETSPEPVTAVDLEEEPKTDRISVN